MVRTCITCIKPSNRVPKVLLYVINLKKDATFKKNKILYISEI